MAARGLSLRSVTPPNPLCGRDKLGLAPKAPGHPK